MSPMPDFEDDQSPSSLEAPKISDDNNTTVNTSKTSDDNDKPLLECDIENHTLATDKEKEATEIAVEIVDNEDVMRSVNGDSKVSTSSSRDLSSDVISESSMQRNMVQLAQVESESCGFPLQIFSQGTLYYIYFFFESESENNTILYHTNVFQVTSVYHTSHFLTWISSVT